MPVNSKRLTHALNSPTPKRRKKSAKKTVNSLLNKCDTDPNKDKVRHHLLLLAQNMTGYKNLLKICSDAQLQGFYYRPRIDADYLAAHAEGLICTTGCMAAEIPYLLNPEDGRPPQPEQALERLRWYLDIFGRERFFIELQEHSIPALTGTIALSSTL